MEMLTRFLNRERFASLAELKREGGAGWRLSKLCFSMYVLGKNRVDREHIPCIPLFFEWDYRVFERLILLTSQYSLGEIITYPESSFFFFIR